MKKVNTKRIWRAFLNSNETILFKFLEQYCKDKDTDFLSYVYALMCLDFREKLYFPNDNNPDNFLKIGKIKVLKVQKAAQL